MFGIRKALVVVVTACAVTLVVGSPASAEDRWENAGWYSAGSGQPQLTICGPADLVGDQACFRRDGDQWFVYDGSGDLLSPYVQWQNRLIDLGGTWHLYRSGECVNRWPYDNWGVCNKNYYESSSVNYYGGRGSQVRFRLCLGDFCEAEWSAWINNNA